MRKKSVIIFASGQGSNAERIIEQFKAVDNVRVDLIVSNKINAGVLDVAVSNDIKTLTIGKEDLEDVSFIQEVQDLNPDLIVLAGFLLKLPLALIKAFPDKIINIHPSLLPKYGGKGMYGKHVHQAVFNAGENESGITVHWVNEEYDSGQIIEQIKCDISGADGPERIADKVKKLEHRYFYRIILNLLDVEF